MIELILQAERALAVGQLDQAERLYRQAAEADPRNSIAVVGLARVALDRGDDRGAYTLARQALDIDPENAAAQRLADRLDEVMRFRGEEPPTPERSGAAGIARTARTTVEGPAARRRQAAGCYPASTSALAPRPYPPPALTVSSGA